MAVCFDQTIGSAKLSQDIFSILESHFLFGSSPPYKPPSPAISTDGKVRILSIDGGASSDGGLLAAAALVRLESHLRHLSGNPSAVISDFFDLAAGSGSGGLLAALLFGRSLSASEALQLVFKNQTRSKSRIGRIFRRSDGIFHQVFGEMTLKDASKPLLVTCYDLNSSAPFVFSRADAVEAGTFDFQLRHVCAATCRPAEVRSLDGGTRIKAAAASAGARANPTDVAVTHVLHNKLEFPFVRGFEDLFVLSIGGAAVSASGNGGGAGDLARIAGACQADLVDQAVAMAFGESRKTNYVRIQGNGISSGIRVDDVLTERSVESVLFQGKKITERTNGERLEWAALELIKEQQRRQESKIPTVLIKPSMTPRTSCSSATTLTTTASPSSSGSPRF